MPPAPSTEETLNPAARRMRTVAWRAGVALSTSRPVPEEVALALTYGGSTHGVMMGTPADLHDFAVGFSFAEGLIESAEEIESVEEIALDDGIELRMWLAPGPGSRFSARRRALAGPTGCGLCGVESLEQAMTPGPFVSTRGTIGAGSVALALASLPSAQRLHAETRAVHAAALWCCRENRLKAIREDVGRHNALDKLAGHVLRTGIEVADSALVMTSRLSVELVQKAARLAVPILVGMSAPTALAVRSAERAGMTLLGVARGDGFEAFTHPGRVLA